MQFRKIFWEVGLVYSNIARGLFIPTIGFLYRIKAVETVVERTQVICKVGELSN